VKRDAKIKNQELFIEYVTEWNKMTGKRGNEKFPQKGGSEV
jgi:hypothetical protein